MKLSISKPKGIIALVALFFFFSSGSFAQSAEVSYKTSAVCKMCKKRLEKDLSLTKGVKTAELDLETKVLTIVYDDNKTNDKKLKKAINKIGYDAEDSPADPKAHDRLPDCCQKDNEHH